MEVVEKSAEGLKRTFTVKVPAAELDEKLVKKLEGMKGQVHLKGFRKGKAPVSYLKKMYGKGMMGEIVQEIVNETAMKAFTDRDLRPAQTPSPQFDGDMEKVVSGDADLEYEVHAEILPDIEPMDVSTLELTRPVAEVSDADIDEAISRLVENNKDYVAKDDGTAAEDGDQLLIDFVGKIDGEAFEGGAGENHPLVLGSDAFIPGFEEQLVGTKKGDELDVKVTFPEEYRAGDLAGKEAVFEVHVHEINVAKDPEINDEFASKLGLENLEDLKTRLKERLEDDFKLLSRGHVKRLLLDKLDEAHTVELPDSMVDIEFQQVWRQVENAERDEEDKEKSEDELKAEYRTIAERRVRLGLVLAEIGKRADVQVPSEELQRAIQEQAIREAQMLQMQGQEVNPSQVLEFYKSNPDAIAQIRAPLFEEKVVDYVIERATVTDETVSKDELMEDPKGLDEL
ncbi:MAG: trigger factor [Pseudomonadota bacterium]